MRIAFVTSFPERPGAPLGGVQAVSVNLAEALGRFDDLDVHIITTRQACTSARIERWGNTTLHQLPWAGGSMLWNMVGPGRRQMREYLGKIRPDVIHVHGAYGLTVKGMAVPCVLTIHGIIHIDTLFSGSRFAMLRSWIWRRIETAGWADQQHIISISPYVKEKLARIATGHIHDIDNPVAESFFDIHRKECRATVFCAATVSPLKNTLTLVDAAATLVKNVGVVELRLAGSLNNQNYVKQVRERIQQKELGRHVHLLGRIDADQVRTELSTASVFALTSLQENSPMGIEEAMAAGVPVVASNRCGIPHLVREGESGFLIDPNDPDDVARRLEQLLKDDELRRSMGAVGRRIALDRFHPARVAGRTREVYLRAFHDCPAKVMETRLGSTDISCRVVMK